MPFWKKEPILFDVDVELANTVSSIENSNEPQENITREYSANSSTTTYGDEEDFSKVEMLSLLAIEDEYMLYEVQSSKMNIPKESAERQTGLKEVIHLRILQDLSARAFLHLSNHKEDLRVAKLAVAEDQLIVMQRRKKYPCQVQHKLTWKVVSSSFKELYIKRFRQKAASAKYNSKGMSAGSTTFSETQEHALMGTYCPIDRNEGDFVGDAFISTNGLYIDFPTIPKYKLYLCFLFRHKNMATSEVDKDMLDWHKSCIPLQLAWLYSMNEEQAKTHFVGQNMVTRS